MCQNRLSCVHIHQLLLPATTDAVDTGWQPAFRGDAQDIEERQDGLVVSDRVCSKVPDSVDHVLDAVVIKTSPEILTGML
jgi:hypothetical protein